MSNITFEYRGETVTYNENTDDWSWGGGRDYAKPEGARKAIDRMHGDGEDGKPKFKPRAALLSDSYAAARYEPCTVTGDAGAEYSSHSYWIAVGKKRTKQRDSYLFADTPTNREKATKIAELEKQRKLLSEQQDDLRRKLETFTDWLKAQEKEQAKVA